MYHSWLDRWDERRAQRGEMAKSFEPLALNPELCIPTVTGIDTVQSFADAMLKEHAVFRTPPRPEGAIWSDPYLTLPSSIRTGTPPNNTVWTRIRNGGEGTPALLVFHHWNAKARNTKLASFFVRQGYTVAEMALPYHLERARPGAAFADHMLSANLGRTLQSMQQAVADGRQVMNWLRANGAPQVMVMGFSLGSWVAGLVAATDKHVRKAVLVLNGGSLADMVWTGRATRHIRAGLEGQISLENLRAAWRPLNLETRAADLARPGLSLQIIYGARDQVVRPDLTRRFVTALHTQGAAPELHAVNCGHYSLGLPQYILPTAFKVRRFLRQ